MSPSTDDARRRIPDAEDCKSQIRAAFTDVPYPGDRLLRLDDVEDALLLEEEFRGKTDWRSLDVRFIDQAPSGFASALSFFSNEALQFYLPAYLLASIDGRLVQTDPVCYLVYGLSDRGKVTPLNRSASEPSDYDADSERFAIFDEAQAAAIAQYLRFKWKTRQLDREVIDQALRNFWVGRAGNRVD